VWNSVKLLEPYDGKLSNTVLGEKAAVWLPTCPAFNKIMNINELVHNPVDVATQSGSNFTT
jgi:hypothetical protein